MKKAKTVNINFHAGQKLRARRIELGLTQNVVGRALGIASQQVQKYEKGVNAMNAQRLYEFALFLKVSPAHFFDGLASPAASVKVSRNLVPDDNAPSDRESLEVLKSFKGIRDYALRKRLADLMRALALQNF